MTDYRRFYIPGSTWFFTVNLAERRDNHLLVDRIDLLREAFRHVKQRKPFRIEVVVIMPDYLHCIWTLCRREILTVLRDGAIPGFSISRQTSISNDALRSSAHPMALLANFADESLIRPKNTTPIEISVDGNAFMQTETGPGRIALPVLWDVVNEFFDLNRGMQGRRAE